MKRVFLFSVLLLISGCASAPDTLTKDRDRGTDFGGIVAASCAPPIFKELANKATLVVTGAAGKGEVVKLPEGLFETHYDIEYDAVLKGALPSTEIALQIRTMGGCLGTDCLYTSIDVDLQQGQKMLFFLAAPNEAGIYGGVYGGSLSACDGLHAVTTIDGKDAVFCFAEDLQNCVEQAIPCPEINLPSATKVTGGEEEQCFMEYITIEALEKQL